MTENNLNHEALRCKYEDIHDAHERILNSKLEHGTGSPEHVKAVTWAESFGPALVVDYLTLRGEIARLMTIVNAAVYLYDNRLGWSDGRNPYAPPEFWDELGRVLGRDPAGFCAAQAEEVALLREWYAADQELDAAEAEFRTPPKPGEIRGNGAFGQAQRRKWRAEEAIRAALKGARNEP